jgi:hypothetical protein
MVAPVFACHTPKPPPPPKTTVPPPPTTTITPIVINEVGDDSLGYFTVNFLGVVKRYHFVEGWTSVGYNTVLGRENGRTLDEGVRISYKGYSIYIPEGTVVDVHNLSVSLLEDGKLWVTYHSFAIEIK